MKKAAQRAHVKKSVDELTPSKGDGWLIIDSDKPLDLVITNEHIKNAKCGDPTQCVIAQALRGHYGEMVDGFQCGSNITKVINGKKCIRYSTPSNLANSLRLFDKTGNWNLPPGIYTLRPLVKSYRRGARWDKVRNSGGVQSVFRGRPAAPTRHAETICQIRKAA